MSRKLPKFDSPPVSETVLSAQFNKLSEFTGSHAGWFWKSYLDKDWTSIKQTIPISEQFEKFGKGAFTPGVSIKIGINVQDVVRHQITTEATDRMLQIQDTRFTYNWIKKGTRYPTYDKLLPAFMEKYELFEKFVSEANLGELILNQWEVTYTNEIYKENLWDKISDIQEILPNFWIPTSEYCDLSLDNVNNKLSYEIKDQIGRIHVGVNYGRKGSSEGPEIIVLQLVARGPVGNEKGIDLKAGFDIGHETIVNLFTDLTSEKAHALWKRKS